MTSAEPRTTTTDDRPGADASTLAWRDPQRPRFHFTAPSGWLNDPNGVCQWNGSYHLFYQYNPDRPVHENIHWGHATSTDLVHWRDEPVALTPSAGPDQDGCWSGVLVDDGGVPTLVYSGERDGRQSMCVATGTADLRHWTKHPANPVVASPPSELDVTEYRDHCVWRHEDQWRQIVGAGIRDAGGAVLLYTSDDLREWAYRGPLAIGDASQDAGVWTGTMWECPDLFTLDDVDVLVVSAWHEGATLHPVYLTGLLDGDRFWPGPARMLDYGRRHFYAPQSFRDDHGRRVMFGWMQEARGNTAARETGWSGVMSLPRLVSIGADGELFSEPVPEVASLRSEALPLGDVHGEQLDIELDVRLPAGSALQVGVRCTPDGTERTVIVLDRPAGSDRVQLSLDRSLSSLDPDVDTAPLGGDVPIGPDDRIGVRILVDHSALEVFAGGRPLSARMYPTSPDAVHAWVELAPVSTTTSARIERFDAWRMASIWDGPRPSRP